LVLRASRDAEQWKTDWVITSNACASYIHSPVLWRDHLYVQSFKEHGSPNTGLVCLDLNGQVKWQTGPQRTFDFGAYLIADGLIFAMHGRTGELFLIEASPGPYRQLAKGKVLEAKGGTVWAPMALSQGKLIVRDLHQMKCLDVRTP
jgi:hypothetical protein